MKPFLIDLVNSTNTGKDKMIGSLRYVNQKVIQFLWIFFF